MGLPVSCPSRTFSIALVEVPAPLLPLPDLTMDGKSVPDI